MNKPSIVILLLLSSGFGYWANDATTTMPAAAEKPAEVVEPVATQPESGEYSPPLQVEWVSEAEAKASGKPVLYLATLTKGCVPCANLKALLANPASIEAMNRFACVLIEDPSANHPWVRHYERVTAGQFAFPAMVFAKEGQKSQVQVGAPDSVAALLQFLDQMEKRFKGEPIPQVIPDSSKTSITYTPKPTLAPASHDTVAPFPIKGRSSGKQERSCVSCRVRGGRCVRPTPGILRQLTFAPSARGRR